MGIPFPGLALRLHPQQLFRIFKYGAFRRLFGLSPPAVAQGIQIRRALADPHITADQPCLRQGNVEFAVVGIFEHHHILLQPIRGGPLDQAAVFSDAIFLVHHEVAVGDI